VVDWDGGREQMAKSFYIEKGSFYKRGGIVYDTPSNTRPLVYHESRQQGHVLGWCDMAAWYRQLEK